MKPRLPHCLIQALLTISAAAMSSTSPAFADVPEGYTPVTITSFKQLANYTSTDYIAFIISNDITDSAYRMTGAHQYWIDYMPNTLVLTFSELESDSNGSALLINKELAVQQFDQLCFSSNSGDNGGAIATSGEVSITGNGAVTFNNNAAETDGGAIDAYNSSSTVTFTGNEDVTFNNNTAGADGGAIEAQSSTVTFTENETMTFSGNSASNGGAVYALSSSIRFTGNGALTFSGNSATGLNYSDGGGAIYAYSSGTVTFTENGAVMFNNNTAANFGGAIYAGYHSTSTVSFAENEAVTFSENSAKQGGAIYADSSSTVTFTKNGTVTFSENTSPGSLGGAIEAFSSIVAFTENGTVMFNNNTAATYGSAICADSESEVSFTGNDAVAFNENSARCAAISNRRSAVNFTGNDAVMFKGNSATDYTYHTYGGALDGGASFTRNGVVTFSGNYTSTSFFAYGGAIYGGISIQGNDSVTFSANYASTSPTDPYYAAYGGAIYTGGTLSIQGNNSVTFSGNYEKTMNGDLAMYRLRSVYMNGGTLTLAAGEGQHITFYDTLYAANSNTGTLTVSYNGDYLDIDGVQRKATGDIIFSGAHAEADLRQMKPNYTQQELTDSLTTEVYTSTDLFGGRLRIEDGAIYKGNGINVAADSEATLRLNNGTLEQTGYNVTMNASTTLDVEGVNSIVASSLTMQNGSTLSFNLGAEEGAMLNLNALLQTGELTITINGDITEEHSLIRLKNAEQYDTSMWTTENITVVGTCFNHLVWNNGVLNYSTEAHEHLDKDTEVDDFGGEEGVDIEGNGHKLTVKHPVDLVHLAMKDGVVRLEGADNNVVRITLTEDGTLELAAGAGLNVGNIVSMVANGSADLEISGDIEISDIKAYGRPGNKGTLSYVNMTTAGDYTIENMTITGSVIDVGEGTTLYLVNVDIKSDTHITDDPARVFAQSAHVELDKTNTWVDKEITAAQDTLLYMCGDTQRSITMAVGSEIVELTSSMFDSVTLTGTDLWLDMTGIAEATYNKDFFTLDFQDLAREMAKAQVDVENLHVYATLDGEKYTEAYSTANGGLTTTLYFQVPEPSTGTLSLLALAALAARRRRK